jgi:four helix bundle protein
VQDFKKLRVWHAAVRLALKVIEALPERSARKVPGLRSQSIRSAMSVHADLVEGCSRSTRQDFLHFVEIAIASLTELEAHMLVARDARVTPIEDHWPIQQDLVLVRRMLLSFSNTLQRRIAEEQAERLRPLSPPAET